MALTDQQKQTMVGIIAAHPKPINDGVIVKCSGRYCSWESQVEDGDSVIYTHARHVTEAIAKVVFP